MCREHADNRFLVTMLSRENQHELCVAARKFGNLMPFGCWWFLNNPSLIDEITRLFPKAPPMADLEGDVLGKESAEPRCPGCRKVATNAVRHLRVPVDIEVTVDLVYCGWCGHLLTTRIVERG